MTNDNATPANDIARPAVTLADCQHNAVVLAGMLRGIDLMANEGKMFEDARISVTIAALEKAEKLAIDLDRVKP